MTLDFSIIIPSFNRPRQLTACLRAIVALDFPKDRYEVIVVDDGGERPAAPAAAHFQKDLILTAIRQRRQGPASARNAGALTATGRFLAFTDDDCRPDPGWLSTFFVALCEQPDVLVGGTTLNGLAANPFSAASQLIQDLVYAHYNSDPDRGRFFASNNIALSASAYRAIGGFNPTFRTSEDRDFCDRWLASGRHLVHVPGGVLRHVHPMSLRSFWKQHVGYGRGARRFYLAHRRRRPDSTTIERGFYAGILARLSRHLRVQKNPRSVAGLLVVWQAANITGFIGETFFPEALPPHTPRRNRETA